MEKKKLLIADSNEAFCETLEFLLREEFCIRIVHSGDEAVAHLDHFQPEVLVLDLMLPGLDGISVLEYAAAHGHKLRTLVATAMSTDYTLAKLQQLQVSYVLLKPCNMKNTAERVREIAEDTAQVTAQDDEQLLSKILLQLGMNPKHNGYHYLCTAVKIHMADNTQALTKELYVAVGAVYGVQWQQVERSIRAALEAAWKRRNDEIWSKWFGGFSALKRPSNDEVICHLAERFRLGQIRKIG